MKLPQLLEELLQVTMLSHFEDALESSRRIERELKMFGSELSPYLHEFNAQLNELCERVEHHRFNDDD